MDSVRVVLTADTHLGFDLPLHERVRRRRRGEDFFANYARVLRHATEARPDVFIHAGDFFDHPRVNPALAARAFEGIWSVAEAGVPVVVVPGNHDRSNLPQSLWLQHPNLHVIREPRCILVCAPGGVCAIGAFPFARGSVRSAFPSLVAAAGIASAPTNLRLLTFHQAVEGATVGPVDFTFSRGQDVIPARSLPRTLTAVLAGHIHRTQVLHGCDGIPPVVYPGSIERTSFAEAAEAKGFFDLTFVRPPSGDWRLSNTDFVPLPARPMATVEIPPTMPLDCLDAFLAKEAGRLPQDAVARLTVDPTDRPDVVRWLTSSKLRDLFPPTMNVERGWSFRNAG